MYIYRCRYGFIYICHWHKCLVFTWYLTTLVNKEEKGKFVTQYLGSKSLGLLVGEVFQSFVLDCPAGKGKNINAINAPFLPISSISRASSSRALGHSLSDDDDRNEDGFRWWWKKWLEMMDVSRNGLMASDLFLVKCCWVDGWAFLFWWNDSWYDGWNCKWWMMNWWVKSGWTNYAPCPLNYYISRIIIVRSGRPTKIIPSGHVAASHSNVKNTMKVLIHWSSSWVLRMWIPSSIYFFSASPGWQVEVDLGILARTRFSWKGADGGLGMLSTASVSRTTETMYKTLRKYWDIGYQV